MADPKFFPQSKKLTLQQISKLTKISLPKSADKNRVFIDISSLDAASKDNVSFLDNKYGPEGGYKDILSINTNKLLTETHLEYEKPNTQQHTDTPHTQ